MGKLTIAGIAKRNVNYDYVTARIGFYLRKSTIKEALREATKQSEAFLKTLLSLGILMKNIHLGKCEISQSHYNNDYTVTARREFKISFAFNMKLINTITDIINQNGYSADFDCEYTHTDKTKIHAELLEEALADSKRKAEIIAQAMGQKIVGIESLNHNCSMLNTKFKSELQEEGIVCGAAPSKLSDEIKAPFSTESEEIEVVWLME